MKKKQCQRIKKASKLLVSALMMGVFSASIMPSSAVEPSAYTLTEVGETDNYNYYNIVDGVKKYFHITPKSNNTAHYKIEATTGTPTFQIKSSSGSDSYHVTPQGTSELRVGDFHATIGSEDAPVVFREIKGYGHGNAVYNQSDIGNHSIYADFISNDTESFGYGGAIRNGSTRDVHATINNVYGNFVNNKASDVGGAIANGTDGSIATINAIKGSFVGNTGNRGGAIWNQRTIGTITGDFISNSALTDSGGAILNGSGDDPAIITTITGNFISNTAENSGGAIYNNSTGTIQNINGDFILNNSNNQGGAIYNIGIIGNTTDGTGGIEGDFISNTGSSGAAIYNEGTITTLKGNFISNSATNGGAIYNTDKVNIVASGNNIIFDGNYVKSDTGKGGAIWNEGTVGLYAVGENDSIIFAGASNVAGAKDIDGIYNDSILNINGNETDTPTTGTVNFQNVAGTGTTNVYGGNVSVAKDLTQKTVSVANGATLTTKGNVTTTSGITNGGTLNILGGKKEGSTITYAIINSAVSGDGTTIFGNDTEPTKFIQADGAITQAVTIKEHTNVIANADMGAEGKDITNYSGLTISADKVKGNIINGSGGSSSVLTLTAGTLSKQISGGTNASTIISSGKVIAEETIQQAKLSISSGATLEINADNLVDIGRFSNNGDLNLTGGTLSSENFGLGKTNITDGSTVGIATGKSVSNLVLGNGSTLDLANNNYDTITVETFNAGDTGNLKFDVSNTQNDQIIVTDTTSGAMGTLNLSGINIVEGLESKTIHLFTGDGNKDNLTIKEAIIAVSDGNYYRFTQNATSKGDIDVLKAFNPDKPWTIQEVIAANTKTTIPEETVKVDTYQLASDINLDSDLGELKKYVGDSSRSLTINGSGHSLNGKAEGHDAVAGITINSGDTLTLNNITMKNFNNNAQGAIFNSGTITSITGATVGDQTIAFYKNTSEQSSGGAIINDDGTIGDITGDFVENSASYGGAIYNTGEITSIIGNFKDNSASDLAGGEAQGGAIYNEGTITSITGDFEGNTADYGGAINNSGTITNVMGSFNNNSATVDGGAIYNTDTVNIVASGNNIIFDGNYVKSDTGKGGAIWNDSTVGLYAKTETDSIIFTGVSSVEAAEDVDGIYNEGTLNINGDGIYTYTGTVELQAVTSDNEFAPTKGITNIYGGKVESNGDFIQKELHVNTGATLNADAGNLIITDGINNNGTLNLTGGESPEETEILGSSISGVGTTNIKSGVVNAIADISQKELNIDNAQFSTNNNLNISDKIALTNSAELTLGQTSVDSSLTSPINLSMTNSTLNLQNNSTGVLNIGTLGLAGNNNLMLDADLANSSMDMLQVASLDSTLNTGTIRISDIKLMSDAIADYVEMPLFIDDTTRGLLANKVTGNLNGLKYSPIYKYDALYNPETGMVGFTRYNTGGYDDFNPSIFAGAVAAQMGGYLNQLNSYEQAFNNMDMNMLMTSSERQAMKMRNKIASVDANLPTYNPNQLPEEQRGLWFKPYASFEKVNLSNGPRVENTMYGAFFGGDSDIIELSNGWDIVYSGYASYDGSHQNYNGVSIYQNGGHLGGTAVWYKGNFFTGLTANAGASVAEANTMYGNENIPMMMAGVANKTGYNWELFNGKFIIQPSLLMSYSFVKTFDYQVAGGFATMNSDPLHAIQLAPSLKFIGNLPKGWQPYASVQMVWNIMDKTKFNVVNVDLPQLSVEPYFQYGVGVQKRWGDRFTGYLQAMLRNGGRTGIALSAGFRWALGKDTSKPNSNKTSNSLPELPKTKIELSSASK